MSLPEGLPDLIRPMLAEAGDLPSEEEAARYAYEMKWDGIRAVAYLGTGVRLLARSDREITAAYPELAPALLDAAEQPLVLDGEIVALSESGTPDFGLLQRRMHVTSAAAISRLTTEVPVTYLAFDLLHLGSRSLLGTPYEERRALLEGLRLTGPRVAAPPSLSGSPDIALRISAQHGLEGIVAKRTSSVYEVGRRSRCWIKAKHVRMVEVVVVGWKPGSGRRAGGLGSLLVAVPGDDGALRYAGHVGTGFTEPMLETLARLLRAGERTTCPLTGPVPAPHARTARWVDPVLVGEVAYGNWTREGVLRHPSWRGLRPDKSPGDL